MLSLPLLHPSMTSRVPQAAPTAVGLLREERCREEMLQKPREEMLQMPRVFIKHLDNANTFGTELSALPAFCSPPLTFTFEQMDLLFIAAAVITDQPVGVGQELKSRPEHHKLYDRGEGL